MTTVTVRDHFNRAWLATAVCCVGVVVTGLSLETSVFSRSIAAALCIGLLCYAASACGSRIEATKLLLFNSLLLALIFVPLRVTLTEWRFPREEFWPWLHRIFRVWWLSEFSAIVLALMGVGFLAIEVADRVGGDATRRRFQWSITAAASLLVTMNIAHFLRPIWCYDCSFPYGLPFTLYTEGAYAGGSEFVWTGLVADAALIPAFAALCTLLWNQIATWLA